MFESLGAGIATIAAGLLIYETYQWLMGLFSELSVLEQDKKLHLLSFPLRSFLSAVLTAVVLVPRLRRALGPSAATLLLIAAIPTGIADYGLSLLNIERWTSHWLAEFDFSVRIDHFATDHGGYRTSAVIDGRYKPGGKNGESPAKWHGATVVRSVCCLPDNYAAGRMAPR